MVAGGGSGPWNPGGFPAGVIDPFFDREKSTAYQSHSFPIKDRNADLLGLVRID